MVVLMAAGAFAACGDQLVPSDQIVLGLRSVDGRPLPTSLVAQQGTTAQVTWGILAVSEDENRCEYLLRYTLGNAISGAKGTVLNCEYSPGQPVTLQIGLTPLEPPGVFSYRFE